MGRGFPDPASSSTRLDVRPIRPAPSPKSKDGWADPNGPIGMRQIIAQVARTTDMLAGEGARPRVSLQIEAVVTDQLEPAGALVAEHLGLPYVSVANALLLNREPDVPPA